MEAFFANLVVFAFLAGQLVRLDFFGLFIPLLDAAVFLLICHQIASRQFCWKKYLAQNRYFLFFVGSLVLSNLVNSFHYSLSQNLVGNLYLARILLYSLLAGTTWFKLREKIFSPCVSLILVALGISQFIILPDLGKLKYQGWDEHWQRLTFPYLDPSFTGIIILILLIFQNSHQQRKKWFVFLFFLMSLSIFLTFSRTSWLCFAMTLIYFFFRRKNRRIIVLTGAGFVTAVFVLFLFSSSLQSYGNRIGRTETIISRLTSMKCGWEIFSQKPLFGVGFNHYKTAYLQRFQSSNQAQAEIIFNRGLSSVENSFVFVLATGGIIGCLAFLRWIAAIWKTLTFHWQKQIFFVILFASFFNNVFFYPFVLIIIFLLPKTEN